MPKWFTVKTRNLYAVRIFAVVVVYLLFVVDTIKMFNRDIQSTNIFLLHNSTIPHMQITVKSS